MQDFTHFTTGALSIYPNIGKKAIISLTNSVCSILGFDSKPDKDFFLKSEGYEDIEIPMNNSFNFHHLKP